MFRAIHRNGNFDLSAPRHPVLDPRIQATLQGLGDLELAILICLIAQEHCMLSAEYGSIQDLQEGLQLICTTTFNLQPVVVHCSEHITIDEFSEAILVPPPDDESHQDMPPRQTLAVDFTASRGRSPSRYGSNTLDNRRIADAIIITNMDLAPESVQVQALELMRTKRIFTRTALHTASKDFMVLAITSQRGARLSLHLNDLFCMSHFHAEEDGLPYQNDDVARHTAPQLSSQDVKELRALAEEARITPEIAAYLHHIVVFMRNNRYIKGGVTATATRQLRAISKTLAVLHGLNFVPPSLVALAVRKIYPHRLKLTTVETERSLQWGSDHTAVKRLLEGVTIGDAIEDVLASVETPL